MPGRLYIEGEKEKQILKKLIPTPVEDFTVADWQTAEQDVVLIGEAEKVFKLHSLEVSIANLVGTTINLRMYKYVNGVERKCYDQVVNITADPPAIPLINGTWGLYGVLRVTLQSNNVADNGQVVDYSYIIEAT